MTGRTIGDLEAYAKTQRRYQAFEAHPRWVSPDSVVTKVSRDCNRDFMTPMKPIGDPPEFFLVHHRRIAKNDLLFSTVDPLISAGDERSVARVLEGSTEVVPTRKAASGHLIYIYAQTSSGLVFPPFPCREMRGQAQRLLFDYVVIRDSIAHGINMVPVDVINESDMWCWDTQNRGAVVVDALCSYLQPQLVNDYGIYTAAPSIWGEFSETSKPSRRSAVIAQKGLWPTVNDHNEPVARRIAAFEAIARQTEAEAARFLVDQLKRSDLDPEWRNSLILCAEHMQVDDDGCRELLWRILLNQALGLRHDTDSDIAPVVFSAIRTSCSLMPTSQITELLPLLEPPSPVDTRLVTLQCIADFFEERPAATAEAPKPLADRVHQLAMKFLDRDWAIAGENAAIGQNATQALASLGDKRLVECVARIKSLQMSWMTRQVKRKLESTLENWMALTDSGTEQAIRLLKQQVEAL